MNRSTEKTLWYVSRLSHVRTSKELEWIRLNYEAWYGHDVPAEVSWHYWRAMRRIRKTEALIDRTVEVVSAYFAILLVVGLVLFCLWFGIQ